MKVAVVSIAKVEEDVVNEMGTAVREGLLLW